MDGVLLETDVIIAFLTAPDGTPSVMRCLLASTTCFTTFIQAAELCAIPGTDPERRHVERALIGLKILGASGRYATTIGRVLASSGFAIGHRSAIVGAMAIESRLPIITDRFADIYARIDGVRVIHASALPATDPAAVQAILDRSATGMPG